MNFIVSDGSDSRCLTYIYWHTFGTHITERQLMYLYSK